MVIHIFNNLLKEYNSLVESINEDLDKGADEELTVVRVRERVRASFRKIALHQSDLNVQRDVALLANGKKVKTRCVLHGKIGHKKEDYCENPKNKKSNKTKNSKLDRNQKKKADSALIAKMKGHTKPYCIKRKRITKR